MYPRLFQRRNKPSSSQNSNLTSILAKTERYFVPVRDISTFKHSFHSILHAECSACPSQRWNKPGRSQNAFFRRFWRKLAVTLFLFEIYRRLNALVVVTTSENDPWLSCRMSWWGSRGAVARTARCASAVVPLVRRFLDHAARVLRALQ